MDLVENAKHVMVGTGATWVMWLLIGLSVVSVALILERTWAFWVRRDDVARLRSTLTQALEAGGFEKARTAIRRSRHPAARVAIRGMRDDAEQTTPEQAEEAMAAEAAAQRGQLESRLGFLGTLGANAPFIGLFGTVIGIVQAFDELGKHSVASAAGGSAATMAPQAVMSSIAEALVATAVGIGVAIPAVFAFNHFQRATKASLAGADILARELLAFLRRAPDAGPGATLANQEGGE
jgi:biopolymer transport protein ExbB/TolQ